MEIANALLESDIQQIKEANPFYTPIMNWMEEQGIIKDENLSPNLVTLKTVLAKPTCCNVSSMDSRISIRLYLHSLGWAPIVESAREADVVGKVFNPNGPLPYFLLLKRHLPDLIAYQEQGNGYDVKHTQSKGYYDALLALFQHGVQD